MYSHARRVFDYWPRKRIARDLGLIILWIVWAVLTFYEYPNVPFVLPTVVGALLGIGYTYWLRRTDSGRFLDDAYRHMWVGYKTGFAIALVVIFYLIAVFFYPLLNSIPWLMVSIGVMGWILAHRLTDSGLLSTRV